MDESLALYLARQSLQITLLLSAPVLITCVFVGVVITIIQAVTALRDMTLTIVPKLVACGAITILLSGWMLETIVRFTTEVFGYIQYLNK